MVVWLLAGCLKSAQVESFEAAWQTIDDSFPYEDFNGVDWQQKHDEYLPQARKAKTNDELRDVLGEMIQELNVSHIGVIPLEEYERTYEKAEDDSAEKSKKKAKENSEKEEKTLIDQGWAGIEARWVEEQLLVTRVEGSAKAAGIQTGWQILKVGDIDTLEPRAKEPRKQKFEMGRIVDAHCRGNEGETVRLRLKNAAGEEVEKELPFSSENVISAPEAGNLPAFGVRFQHRQIEEANVDVIGFNIFLMPIRSLIVDAFADIAQRQPAGLVIDLRGNPGGLIGLGTLLSSYVVSKPELDLGEQISRDGRLYLTIHPRPPALQYQGPVAILVDELSASTSEVLAGGLQELGRVRIFGEQSAGKALPSMIAELPNGDRLQYVILDLKTISGKRYEGDGVRPDELVVPTKEALQQGKDLAMEAAVSWIGSQKSEE